MKLLVLGDIHGRPIWSNIIEKESPDKVVFLGDYITSHENISETQQLSNLENILKYKEDNKDKVVLLRGNHDLIGYSWSECSPEFKNKKDFPKERFLKNSQWVYILNNMMFSHAGISTDWMNYYNIKSINDINDIEPCEIFGFTPKGYNDYYGTSPTQPCTWIRPITLTECAIKGYTQIIGHTPVVNCIFNIKELYKNSENIWLCDALAKKQYLVINNENFEIHNYDE